METSWDRLDVGAVVSGGPVRRFRSYRGQRHYSGWYWSATMGRLLAYESRLELSWLVLADFDRTGSRRNHPSTALCKARQ